MSRRITDADKWAEEILRAVAEVENERNEEYEDVDFSNTRYSDGYEESLLASVY